MSQPAAPKKQTPREAAHKKAVGVIRELDLGDAVCEIVVEVLRKKFSKHSAAGKPKKTKKKEAVSS